MAFDRLVWRHTSRSLSLVCALTTFVLLIWGVAAHAERSTFRTYDADQGLASLGGSCMVQDRAGILLVCSEHGVFAYDGRRFVNLGADQGLRQGGTVFGIALTPSGRVVVGYTDEVLVSDRPSDVSHPPQSLSFRTMLHPGISLYDERPHRFAPWRRGMVLLAGDTAVAIAIPGEGAPFAMTMGYDLEEQRLLQGATAVFSVRGQLWETFADGRVCAADPGMVRCYDAAAGLRGGPWMDIVAGPDGRTLARSASSVGTFDPVSGRWSVIGLPDQGGRYANYARELGLFRTPGGGLITQADHGLAILGPSGWHTLDVEDGAPSGDIVSALTDATGQLWFQILGRGLVRWVGYGHWETMQKADGLSDGISWQSVRTPAGALWVSTDTGIDEIVRRGPSLRVGRVFAGASFALAVGPHGRLWSSVGASGIRIIDPAAGSVTEVALPPVDAIVPGRGDFVWIGTESGLFRVEDHPGAPPSAVLKGSPRTPVPAISADGVGGVFYLSGGRLRHQHSNGSDVSVTGDWPKDGFEPLALTMDHGGGLWVGGPGGLFRFLLSNDHVTSYEAVPTADTQTNTTVALMVDHRGWVWAGSALGVSVFNGRRWISVNVDGGLLSDDVDQGGIREDPDGSVWIATTQGFSHLLDPAWLFAERPIQVVVSQALLGVRSVLGGRMPYTEDGLSIQFGTPNYGAERTVQFRYRLAGVDAAWVESSSGSVRYPFVPPGRHVLTVVGYDELSHRSSKPVTLLVHIAYPWWRRWWSESFCAVGVVLLAYGLMRLRLHAVLAKQAELKRHIAAATEEIRYQAAHDKLTGLLNRSEIEARLAKKLAGGVVGDQMVVALIDIDHFKRVNDNHGHLGGDDVLRAMGRLVSRSVRAHEYAGRYGGEEILLVLDDSDCRGAERVLDLHLAVRHDTFRAAGAAIHVTCSIGLAWATPGDDWESLIGRADEALYEAKESGRDRVIESRRVDISFSRTGDSRPAP